MPERLLRLKEVLSRVPLSKSRIYQLTAMNPPGFPRPVLISPRVAAWRESEIDAWIAAKIDAAEGSDREHPPAAIAV